MSLLCHSLSFNISQLTYWKLRASCSHMGIELANTIATISCDSSRGDVTGNARRWSCCNIRELMHFIWFCTRTQLPFEMLLIRLPYSLCVCVFVGGDFVSIINHHAWHHWAMENEDYEKKIICYAFMVEIYTNMPSKKITVTLSARNWPLLIILFPFFFLFPGLSFNIYMRFYLGMGVGEDSH